MANYNGDTITIRKLFFQETGSFHDVYASPLEMTLSDGVDELIRDRIIGAGEGRLTSKAFLGIASRVLAPSMDIDRGRDRIDVPDGWDSQRCRFSMEVFIERRLGEDETMFIHGYTDHKGLAASGAIDEDMVLYINGFIRVGYAERQTAYGMEEVPVVREIAQVAAGKLIYDRDQETHLGRPSDIFGNLQRQMYDTGTSVPLSDNRTRLRSPVDAIFSQRRHNLAGDYLADTLQSYRNALSFQNYGNDRTDVIGISQQRLNSEIELMRDNVFLRALGRVQGVNNSVSFTMSDLLDIDPDIENNPDVTGVELTSRALAALATRDNASRWDDSTIQAQWARQITSGLSAIIMSRYHRGLVFTATSRTQSGKVEVVALNPSPVVDNLPRHFFEDMMDDIEDFFIDISRAGRIDFDVEVNINQYDQTKIELSIGRDPEELFYVPSFADALLAPIYTRQSRAIERLVNDFSAVIEDCTGELGNSASALADGM